MRGQGTGDSGRIRGYRPPSAVARSPITCCLFPILLQTLDPDARCVAAGEAPLAQIILVDSPGDERIGFGDPSRLIQRRGAHDDHTTCTVGKRSGKYQDSRSLKLLEVRQVIR